ncbi:MAG: hypothetical protein IJI12_06155 [Atopobiaceae bacterium]|nr:hypothetical protein [Atopobiaceae bacterium]
MLKKLPPLEKVYEAWSALADGRVRKTAAGYEIDSSDRGKTYNMANKDAAHGLFADENRRKGGNTRW